MDLVSVVIATYNRADILPVALRSVFSQTYPNIEVIVVDDGSTDSTAEVVRSFPGTIRYIHKPNGGVSSARNTGIRAGKGEYVAFLDSDDSWAERKIERQVDFLRKHPECGMALCDCRIVDPEGRLLQITDRRSVLPRDGRIVEDVLLSPVLIPSSMLVRKDILEEVGGFDETLVTAEDLDLHLRISLRTGIGLVTEPLCTITKSGRGLSALSRTYDDHVLVVERFLRDHGGAFSRRTCRSALFRTYRAAATGEFWMGRWSEGFRYTLRASRAVSSLSEAWKAVGLWERVVKYALRAARG